MSEATNKVSPATRDRTTEMLLPLSDDQLKALEQQMVAGNWTAQSIELFKAEIQSKPEDEADKAMLALCELALKGLAVQSETASRDAIIEECAKVADSDFCLPGCDSFGHEDLCPIVNPGAAIRALKNAAPQAAPSRTAHAITAEHPEKPAALPTVTETGAPSGSLREALNKVGYDPETKKKGFA